MADKGPTFSSFVYVTPFITLDKLMGSENYPTWANSVELRFIGNGCEDYLTTPKTSITEDRHPQWRKIDALLCNILQQSINVKTLHNFRAYRTCYTLWTRVKRLYTNAIKHLYLVISSIFNLKQSGIELSCYVGQMFALKDGFSSIMLKSTNAEISQSKTDRVFMTLTLFVLGLDLENIQEQIIAGTVVPTFDEVFARLFRHSSTTTQSLL